MKDSLLLKKATSLFNSNIFKVFYSTGFTTGLKILGTIVLSKIVAVRLGPAGLALLGQLTNFVTIALLIASGGFGNGIVKYVSSLKNDVELDTFTRQSFKLTLLLSLITGLLILIFCNYFSQLNFNSSKYTFVFITLGISIIMYAAGNYFLSFLNGMSDYKVFNWSNGLNSIASLTVSVLLIQFYGLAGAFVAVAINQSVSGIITIGFSWSYFKHFTSFWRETIQLAWVKKLLAFSLMAGTTAVLTPLVQMIIRKELINQHNAVAAGEWEAINRISGLYLSVIINVMMVYYLPKLSSLNEKGEIKNEINKGFKFFTPIVIVLAAGLFICKGIIIQLFLSDQFAGIKPFFLPQLVGDVFKVLSLIYAYLVIAKAKISYYVISEVAFTGVYLLASLLLINRSGNIGAVYAYTLTYILYFLFQVVVTRKYILHEYSNPRRGLS